MYGWLVVIALSFVIGLPGCGGSDGSCKDGKCACASGQTDCSGTCIDTMSDPGSCGACGVACSANESCIAGSCQVPCDTTKLMGPVADSWGATWDGIERTAATLDAANLDCSSFGGRLPNATEISRVNALRPGGIGQSFHTNFLWSRTANDRLTQVTARLSDGTVSAASAVAPSAIPYRCVCAAQPRAFAGSRCNGPAGSECFQWGPYNIDKADRPPLRKSAAVQECVGEHAHLADLPVLGPAIRAGLPGSNVDVSTADGASYHQSTTIRWSGPAWELAGNTSFVELSTPAPFRCVGTATPAAQNATAVPNEFRPALSPFKSETMDHAAASFAAAHDTCWRLGGHLPRSSELAELIAQGLPGGTNQALWTSDEMGYNGTQFLAAVLRWSAIDRRFPFEYVATDPLTSATWVYKTDAHAFRCIFYPLDPTFQPPTSCNGGCNVRSAGSPPVTVFFDQADRPAATVAAAMADCAATGGYLASERDLIEAVREGLPGGSGTFLNTWDMGNGNAAPPGTVNNLMVARWSGVDRAFDGQYSTYMTWVGPTAMQPYRCMWTNELR